MPDATWMRMKFTQYFGIASTGGSFSGVQVFRGNSVYDPDLTGTGRQPTGFDQIATFYSRYYVAASKIVAEFVNTTENCTHFLVYPHTVPANTNDLNINVFPSEYPYYRLKVLGTQNGGRNWAKHKMYMNTAKMWGITNPNNDPTANAALTSANPTRQWYWNVCAVDTSGTVDVTQVEGRVTITYYVKFFGKNAINIS